MELIARTGAIVSGDWSAELADRAGAIFGATAVSAVIVSITATDTTAEVAYSGTASHYRLDGGSAVSLGASPYTITGLTANTEYTLEIGDGSTWYDSATFGTDNPGEGGGGPAVITGTLAVTETGSDASALSGAVFVAGVLAALEVGSDAAALTGQIRVAGSLAASETGSDTASILGAGTLPAINGSLSATETGSDTAAGVGYVRINGTLVAVEVGSDSASIGPAAAAQPLSAPPSGRRVQGAGRPAAVQAGRRQSYRGSTR